MTRKTCKMELSMKVVEQDKSQMVNALYARRKSAAKGVPPALPAADIAPSDDKRADETDSAENWVKFEKPILWMVAGKGPYVSRCIDFIYVCTFPALTCVHRQITDAVSCFPS